MHRKCYQTPQQLYTILAQKKYELNATNDFHRVRKKSWNGGPKIVYVKDDMSEPTTKPVYQVVLNIFDIFWVLKHWGKLSDKNVIRWLKWVRADWAGQQKSQEKWHLKPFIPSLDITMARCHTSFC